MSAIYIIIAASCNEGNGIHAYIWICVTIIVLCIWAYLAILMILKYLKEKHIREEQQEMEILEKQKTMDDLVCIKNKLSEINKKVDEIKSGMESRS